MNDLLADSFAGEQNRPGGDIELGMQVPLNLEEVDLDKFLKQVSELEAQYSKLDELLKKLQAAHEESKSVTSASAVKGIKQKMEKNVDEVGKIARHLKLNIEEIEKDNLADSKKRGRGKGTTMERSRAAKTNALRRKLKDKMADFQSLRENIHNEYHAVVRRRVFTVTGKHVDDEAIEELIGTGEGEHIFQKAIQEQGRGQILGTLNEIKERHDSVIEVERKLQELQQIFLDMAVLVDAQGEILDNIEVHVSSAVDHVQTGNTALQRAKSLQKSSRKWMCIAIIILLLIVAVIVVAVIKPWTKSA